MILYDFQCKCGSKFEALAKMSDTTCECKRCGKMAQRLISMPRIALEGHTGQFPTAHARWVKIHEEEARKTTSE